MALTTVLGEAASLFAASQYAVASKTNALPVMEQLFTEHRGPYLTGARDYVERRVHDAPATRGGPRCLAL